MKKEQGIRKLLNIAHLAVSLGAVSLLGILAKPIQAQELFGNEGIRFNVDTIVEMEFVESHGAYQSTFGVINLETGEKTVIFQEVKPSDNPQPINVPSSYLDDKGDGADFLGTPGNTVPNPKAEFYFKANMPYAFYLESSINSKPATTLYSVTVQNPNGQEQTRFNGGFADLNNGGVIIRWDDSGSQLVKPNQQDTDFDDFIVIMGGHQACNLNDVVCPLETLQDNKK